MLANPLEIMNLLLVLHNIFGRKSASGMVRAWIGPLPMFFATTAEAAEVISYPIPLNYNFYMLD
jgi:hypothetical protein